jgi:quercetin dioxygenase-like cupin family protein
MHVTPSELRILRQDGILIRFALLGEMAYVLAEFPSSGSSGTSIEQSCAKPHWGFVLEGDVTFEAEGRHHAIPPGSAFHIPAGGPHHRFRIVGDARLAGFEPIDPVVDASDAALAVRGFELLPADASGSESIVPTASSPLLEGNEIEARTWPMSSFVLTRARFGPGSGYLDEWCDAPHWGLVTAGRLAIEWEEDIEILSAGDIYHCPAGPPGHRFEAADPAGVIDLTPIDSLVAGTRTARWRQAPTDGRTASRDRRTIAVADLR